VVIGTSSINDLAGNAFAGLSTYDFSSVGDTVPPTVAITSSKSALKAGETATITFTLSEPATDFAQSGVTATGGTLSGFTGSGTNYTAIFTPSVNSTANGVVSVASDKFSDAAGNFNKDGADANNTVTITRELNATRTHALTVLVDKGVLGVGPVLLKDLLEEITTTGTTVTSHTVTYGTAKFTYSDVDALITTVIRDGEFTEEFRKEIADQYPSFGSITYKDAVSLVGAAAIDGILISVAGADGNFVG